MYWIGSCNWMTVGEWCLATVGFGVSQIWGSTREAGKGNDMLEPTGWVVRRRKRGAAVEPGVR